MLSASLVFRSQHPDRRVGRLPPTEYCLPPPSAAAHRPPRSRVEYRRPPPTVGRRASRSAWIFGAQKRLSREERAGTDRARVADSRLVATPCRPPGSRGRREFMGTRVRAHGTPVRT